MSTYDGEMDAVKIARPDLNERCGESYLPSTQPNANQENLHKIYDLRHRNQQTKQIGVKK